MINFGETPVRSTFTLSSDYDFYQQVETRDGSSYPGTAAMSLKLLDSADAVLATWTATFAADVATIRADKAVVAAVLLLTPVQGRVFYEDGAGGPELVLAQGDIRDVSP